jgi:hypothetical protein
MTVVHCAAALVAWSRPAGLDEAGSAIPDSPKRHGIRSPSRFGLLFAHDASGQAEGMPFAKPLRTLR